MEHIANVIKNSLAAVLTIAALGMAVYVALFILEWAMRIKSRNREQAGLTQLWSSSQKQAREYEDHKERSG